MDTIGLFGLPLLSGDLCEVAKHIANASRHDHFPPQILCHINANNFERIRQSPALAESLRNNAILLMDGIGIKLAAACLGKGWKPDINGTDLFPLVMNHMEETGESLFLLGGSAEVSGRAAENIAQRWCVKVAGHRSGFFAQGDEPEICRTVNESGAQVVLVGRGCPLQEEFVLRNRPNLRVRLIWTVGGLFDFLSGTYPRAPLFWRKARLEWMFRWLIEPRSKAHRTWVLYPRFAARVIWERITANSPQSATAIDQRVEPTQTPPTLNVLTTTVPVRTSQSGFSVAALARTATTEFLARQYGTPPYLIIFVSDQCWMRCSHCWFSEDWKEAHHKRPLLSFDEYGRLADSARLHFVSFTGGEAFRRDDIVELITMMKSKSGITRYQIPTSGYLPEMIEQKATQLLRRNPDTPFRVDVSLDGTPAVHDHIRRVKGGWEKAVDTIKRLNRLKDKYAHFDVGVITTISRRNQDHVDEIAGMVKSFHPGEWMINITRGKVRDPKAVDVDLANYLRASDLADMSIATGSSRGHRGGIMGPLLTAKNIVRRRIIAETIGGHRTGGGCAAGSLGGVIYADGSVHACEMLDDELGNLHDFDYDLRTIWQGDAARNLRRYIQESRCQCTQECFLSVSMLIQPTALVGMAGELAKRGAKSVSRAIHVS